MPGPQAVAASAAAPAAVPLQTATAIPAQGSAQRGALKFGFGGKPKAGGVKLGKVRLNRTCPASVMMLEGFMHGGRH